MPLYSLAYDRKDPQSTALVDLTDKEEECRRRDWEEINNELEYHNSFKQQWAFNGAQYNMIQQGTSDDRVSNFYISMARMIIDQGIGMMTEGEPDFDIDPVGPSDYKKVILWKSLIKLLLSKCNWKAHQDRWITDLHVFGSSPLEVYTQLPMRTRRIEKEDGTIEERLMRDFRRMKVGIRHVPIWSCWRNPNIADDPEDVPSGGRREYLTRAQFIQNYANVLLPNGKPKFKNIEMVLAGNWSHIMVTIRYHEIADVFRMYAIGHGSTPEGRQSAAPEQELGIPIFDKPLSITRIKATQNGLEMPYSSGANVPGMTPLCFGTFADQMDADYKTHAVYGMGIPQMIDGPDAVMQAMFNMTVDNMRLKNTVVIGYKSYDGRTALDIDAGMAYSGQYVDGEINPQSLGVADMSSNGMLWEWLNNISMWITGINFQQLGGDTSKTAYEFSQRIRANNQRAEKRLRGLENTLKRAALVLLANALSETTVEEWEELSEEQVKEISERIASDDVTGEDVKEESGKKYQRVHLLIPVQGKKWRENFKGKSKTRQIGTKDVSDTLVTDPTMLGETSHVPSVREYLYPAGGIEALLQFNIRVDGKRMLGDMKAQDMDMMTKLGDYFSNRFVTFASLPEQLPSVDMKKLDLEMIKFAGIDERTLQKDDSDGSALLQAGRQAEQEIEQLLSSPTLPNGSSPLLAHPGAPTFAGAAQPASPQPRQPQGPPGGTVPAPNMLQGVSAGTV